MRIFSVALVTALGLSVFGLTGCDRADKAPSSTQADRGKSEQAPLLRLGACVGKGGFGQRVFWGPPGRSCNGMTWGTYGDPIREGAMIGSCKGQKVRGNSQLDGVVLYGPPGEWCAGTPGWGTYTNPQMIAADGLGFCVGQGGGISGQILWGPKGAQCAGMSEWPKYE